MELYNLLNECYCNIANAISSCNAERTPREKYIKANINKAEKAIEAEELAAEKNLKLALLPFSESVYIPLLNAYKEFETAEMVTMQELKTLAKRSRVTAYPLFLLLADKFKDDNRQEIRTELATIDAILHEELNAAKIRLEEHNKIVADYRDNLKPILRNLSLAKGNAL